ncbi:hypothetical protein [Devosia sp. SL43]|uniref:hypothetical protein n=1 Tax=Devosia sp. SL43 TaxID=2806348 RepID=UPI001F3F74AD|nr:hypothetical protein [Devosia sp. SL43]UJW84195.1 hypothetical protein IM737_12190 [Devosia sp. SL43]
MRKIILTAAILGLSSTMAFAQTTATFADIDTDTSGDASLVELQVFWPDFTQETFTAADTDASGGLSADELTAISTGMTGDPAASTGAGSVGNPSGSDGTPADDDNEDSTMGDTEGTESLSPTAGD